MTCRPPPRTHHTPDESRWSPEPPAASAKRSLSACRQVIHRMAEPDDIAGSVLILAADQAGWITGQTIMANGGNSFGL
jgi:NAD(P)-dependent dehydrogenase (short-subunit alcohol dehydrogenase family)